MHRFIAIFLASVTIVAASAIAAPPSTRPVEGLRDHTPAVHALINARIVTAPGRSLENGVLVIRNGVIEAVGAKIEIPADARVWDLNGKVLYPGLIDAFTEVALDASLTKNGSPHWNDLITPQLQVARHISGNTELDKTLRSQGITLRLVAPARGVLKGVSAVVTTADVASPQIVNPSVALHAELTVPPGRDRKSYPNSPMGAVALARQTMYDARWYRDAWTAHRGNPATPRPERNDALEALAPFVFDNGLVIIEANDEQYFLRADRFAREFGLNLAVCGSGHEYRRLKAIVDTGRPVLVPLNFPQPPNVSTPEAALRVTLEELMHWDIAPENPARLEKAGVRIALTSHRLSDKAKFLEAVRRAVRRGLDKDAALRALTSTPAELLGVADRAGSLEPGKAAHVVVTDGNLFDDETQVLEVWIDGQRHEIKSAPQFDVRGVWRVTFEGASAPPTWEIRITGEPAKLSGVVVVKTDNQEDGKENNDNPAAEPNETKIKQLDLRDARIAAAFPGDAFGKKGVARLSAVVSIPQEGEATWLGAIAWPDGATSEISAVRTEEFQDPKEKKDSSAKSSQDKPASFAVNFPLGAFGREAPPDQPDAVVFQNATVWTCSEAGILENASVLIGKGKILAVGQDIKIPRGAVVIDAQGKHITPGIIDCHSHMATDGGINESTQAITAEVRIGDFIDATDISIYRQLAGGVTAANILHGSANPIGGQNQVIKLRWGALPEELKMAGAPPGIKFALGENVKQSNWGDDYRTRYPQSRMGVEQIMRDAILAGRDYRHEHAKWRETHQALPPRVDLELEALAEVAENIRWIHCHSYRQDEILALLRTLEEFNIRIGTLQHVLEGYKVADAMARHGAMGSAFSDWWAYKFEVYDAVPFAGALMHRAGVVVSFNSDDAELARRLNQEAAKAVKYGGVPPEEALKFVTLNPAKQLRIDRRVGSLTRGKDADLVVWSGSPLSNYSVCEQTWIDGRKYFDRAEDLALRQRQEEMRAVLVQKALASNEAPAEAKKAPEDDQLLYRHQWPRIDIYCGAQNRDGRSP